MTKLSTTVLSASISTEGKFYSRERVAKAKAKEAGLNDGEFYIETSMDGKQFAWGRKVPVQEVMDKALDTRASAQATIDAELAKVQKTPGKGIKVEVVDAPTLHVASVESTPAPVATPAAEPAPRAKRQSGDPVKTKMPSWAKDKHRSEMDSPTKSVWHIADEMVKANPTVARKVIVQECVKRGIAYYTARTQVQLWKAAAIESAANAAKVNAKK